MGTISIVIIMQSPIVHHCRNIWMLMIMLPIVIAVGINKNGQSMEIILITKYRSLFHSFFCIPYCHTITEKILSMAVNFKLYLHFPTNNVAWHRIPECTLLTLPVRRNPYMIWRHEGTSMEIPKRNHHSSSLVRFY
uniref:Putative secreted protein n=1 Tax=Panstrongylus lignarius TaxID=156445 RepID=A0A224XZS3_9HEMI